MASNGGGWLSASLFYTIATGLLFHPMKICPPNYTQVPNVLLDEMAGVSASAFKVAMLVCRQTFGFHRESAELSISFIATGTGLSKQTAVSACEELLAAGMLENCGNGTRGVNKFRLLIQFDSTNILIGKNCHSSKSLTSEAVSPVKELDTNKESKIKKLEHFLNQIQLVSYIGSQPPADFTSINFADYEFDFSSINAQL